MVVIFFHHAPLNFAVLLYVHTYVHCFTISVKFSIKSFKVPELYIEVPETATVGSLKVGLIVFSSGVLLFFLSISMSIDVLV